jgi:hypothetical protein
MGTPAVPEPAGLGRSSPRREQSAGILAHLHAHWGALAAWTFAGLTQDVVGHDEMALFDPRAEQWVVAVRTVWLTGAMRSATWLGSTAVIVPTLVLMAAVLVIGRRDWRSAILLGAAVAGAVGLYNIVKVAVERPRPPRHCGSETTVEPPFHQAMRHIRSPSTACWRSCCPPSAPYAFESSCG